MYKILIICSMVLIFGCKKSRISDAGQVGQNDVVKVVTQPFKRPDVPTMITDPNLRLEYAIKHYWDYFDFEDTTYIPTPDITEQAWVDYIDLLFHLPLNRAQEEMKTMMTKSAQNSKKLFEYFTEMADKYFYDPNSPVRNEELYIPVLEVMIQTTVLDDTEKIRPQYRLDWAYKNRIGSKSTDFQYTEITGQTGMVFQINANYLLLFFNHPECSACIEHVESIRNSAIINMLLQERKLKILSIYSDSDLDEWKRNHAIYPSEWIISYDKSFTIGEKYDLKASPTLYLLDKDKKVILKDASFFQLENYLAFTLQQN